MINPQDISVVIQGTNIKNVTDKCIKSIRRYLPGATIIFSTYENHDVGNLDCDVVVRSKDPGATQMYKKWHNQTNRILVTSKAGLDAVKTKYVIRMRSDLMFKNSKILNDIAKQFPKRDKTFSVFKERVLFYCLWCRYKEHVNKNTVVKRPFELSDWLCFGLTEDVKNYYDCPLTPEPEFTKHFDKHKNFYGAVVNVATWALAPEQWVCMNFFARYFPDAKMKDVFDYDGDKVALSKNLLLNNIIPVGYREIGVYIHKKPYKFVSKHISNLVVNAMHHDWLDGVYMYKNFVYDYKQTLEHDDEYIKQSELLRHLKNHIMNTIKPVFCFRGSFTKIRYWLGNVISIVYYIWVVIRYYIFGKTKKE